MSESTSNSPVQDYEAYLSERSASLSEQLGRAKVLIETLIRINEEGWSKDDPAYILALQSAQRFLET